MGDLLPRLPVSLQGSLQGLAYPAGRPQQLAQATLRVIAIRTALADAIAELGAA